MPTLCPQGKVLHQSVLEAEALLSEAGATPTNPALRRKPLVSAEVRWLHHAKKCLTCSTAANIPSGD